MDPKHPAKDECEIRLRRGTKSHSPYGVEGDIAVLCEGNVPYTVRGCVPHQRARGSLVAPGHDKGEKAHGCVAGGGDGTGHLDDLSDRHAGQLATGIVGVDGWTARLADGGKAKKASALDSLPAYGRRWSVPSSSAPSSGPVSRAPPVLSLTLFSLLTHRARDSRLDQ